MQSFVCLFVSDKIVQFIDLFKEKNLAFVHNFLNIHSAEAFHRFLVLNIIPEFFVYLPLLL